MGMFSAYFDDSGHESSTVLTVGGFLATIGRWEKFSDEWNGLLPEGISEFHMQHFAQSSNAFRRFRNREADRRALLTRLLRVIKKRAVMAISSSVILADYNALNKEFPLVEAWGHPYALCGYACALHAEDIATKKNQPMPELVFDDGSKYKGS